MTIKVRLMGSFKDLLNRSEILIDANGNIISILDLINHLDMLSDGQFRALCLNKEGNLNYTVLIFINGTEVSALQELNTEVSNTSEIVFLPTIHGGNEVISSYAENSS